VLQRVIHALGLILLVCLGARVAAWLIAPILPALGILVVLASVGYWLLGGARSSR
jgi:hypothetical protein